MSISNVSEALGITERNARHLIHEKQISYVKIGKAIKVPKESLIEYLNASLNNQEKDA